jgi:hypothetical protein
MSPLLSLLAGATLAAGSPWWEDYTTKETFLCPNQGRVVLERNDAQASLITGRYRSTLFRDASVTSALLYRNELISVSLRGDLLTMERLPNRVECLRTEQV